MAQTDEQRDRQIPVGRRRTNPANDTPAPMTTSAAATTRYGVKSGMTPWTPPSPASPTQHCHGRAEARGTLADRGGVKPAQVRRRGLVVALLGGLGNAQTAATS